MSHNANTRALVSALQSDIPALRAAALKVVRKVTRGAEYPAQAIMAEYGASKPTAYKLWHLVRDQ